MDAALMRLLAPYEAAQQGTPISEQIGGLGGLLSLMPGLQNQQQGSSASPSGSYDSNGNRWEQLASQMAQKKYGWGANQFNAIDQIASAESGWNPNAVNPSSGAYGIPQILPSAHPDSLGLDPRQQIAWMLHYIQGRYGTPQHALDVRQQQGWY